MMRGVRPTLAEVTIRRATASDLQAIVDLLADDPLGRQREAPGPPLDPAYAQAFAAVDTDPNALLLVAENDACIVGCCQINILAGLSRKGMLRGQIESVRVAPSHRGLGLGQLLIEHAIDACRQRSCGLVQLTTDKSRDEAHRFYERLGFVASHVGMKLGLDR